MHLILIHRLSTLFCLILFGVHFPFTSSLFTQDKTDKGKVFYQLHYRPGDWITYTNTRNVNSLSTGHHQVFAGTAGGVVRYHYIRKTFDYPLTTSNGLLDNDVRVTGYDSRTGYLWIATKQGLHYWDPYSERMNSARYAEIGLSGNENILSIGFENSGNIWIQTGSSFYYTAGNLRNFVKSEPADQIITWNGMLFHQHNKLPNLFTAGGQSYQYDAAGKAFVDNDFNRYPVTCFTFDAGGLLWTGTAGAGLWYAETLSNLMKPLPFGLFMNNVTAMTFDDERMWTGGILSPHFTQNEITVLSGLTEWNQDTDIFTHHPSTYRKGILFDETQCLLADSMHVWIGTGKGLIQKTKNNDYWTTYGAYSGLYHPSVYSLVRHQNKLFIGTRQGLNYAIPGKNNYDIYKVEIPELFNLSVYKMLSDGPVLWLGTNNGIYSIDESRKTWFHYSAYGFKVGATAYTREEVRGIAENDSFIYFAANNNIVSRHKTSGEWLSIPLNTDFLAAGVNDARADRDNLWIATNSGILRLHLKKRKWYFYSSRDGLGDDTAYSILIDGDYVWFGNRNGVTQFYWNAPHLRE